MNDRAPGTGRRGTCRPAWLCVVATLAVLAPSSALAAGERYALIVTGAPGGPQYAEKYLAWRTRLVTTLREDYGYEDDHLIVLGADEGPGVRSATRENVRAALATLQRRSGSEDVVLVLLIGHGTAEDFGGLGGREGPEGSDAKFNLVGPDLTAAEWADLVEPIAGQLVFVNAASASFPFLRPLSRRGRIVVTATDIAAQQFETVFPEFFVTAFDEAGADLDKNGRVSIWEAFSYAGDGVRTWFEAHGQLPTERPLLDDSGDGVGREAGAGGDDGALARQVHLRPDAPVAQGNAELTALLGRRAELESSLEALKANKPALPAGEYERRLEELLLEIARVEQRVREKR